jgi:hypothetical protein
MGIELTAQKNTYLHVYKQTKNTSSEITT